MSARCAVTWPPIHTDYRCRRGLPHECAEHYGGGHVVHRCQCGALMLAGDG